jgi:hypothetical protein
MPVLTFDDLTPGKPAGKKGVITFDDIVAAPAPAGDKASFLQQAFDLKNPSTGESYLYGNTPEPSQLEDLGRTVSDTVTRGYLDKVRGPEAQAATEAARERMPGWVEYPMDIVAGIASSPYRILSAGAGALAGGAEGVASAYGHQEGWVPDLQGMEDMVIGGATGALAGAGGAKLGEKIGDWWSGRQSTKAQPYKTDAELNTAAATDPTGDLAARAARVAKVRAAQGSPRDEFARQLSGVVATPEEAAKLAAIAKEKSLRETLGTNKAVKTASLISPNRTRGMMDWLGTLGTEAALRAVNPIPGAVTGTRLAATALDAWGRGAKRIVPQGSADELAALMRDPGGHGISADPAAVDRWRDMAAKFGISFGRSP